MELAFLGSAIKLRNKIRYVPRDLGLVVVHESVVLICSSVEYLVS